MIENELGPSLLDANVERGGSCPHIFRQVRGHRMAKAALENAVWDLEAQAERISLAELLGGTRSIIPCGVSIGIQPTEAQLMKKIETELAAGYQRIKLKCKPGWDNNIFEAVRNRWPDITLSCDANSAYRMRDLDHIASWDQFNLLMIEQPLWYDDFYFHSMLQKRLKTDICLDESIRNRRDALAAIDVESCRIINIKVGRVGGSARAKYTDQVQEYIDMLADLIDNPDRKVREREAVLMLRALVGAISMARAADDPDARLP